MNEGQQESVLIHPPAHALQGRVRLPGSKSVTNRALLLAALAPGKSRLTGALSSDDTRHMSEALRQMGVSVAKPDPTTFDVEGDGRLRVPDGPLFLGNAGTAMRFLTAASCLVDGTVVVDGDGHMRRRPIGPLVEALRALGVTATDTNGCPPVQIQGTGGFSVDRVQIDGSLSSQFVSAVLMAAVAGNRPLEVEIVGGKIGGRGYIDITLSVMKAFGATVTERSDVSWLVAPTGYTPRAYEVEPDASAATYLWAAEVLTGGKIDLGVAPADMSQPDARAYDVIASFPHMPAVIDGAQIQDSVPTLAVLAAFNETPVRFTGIANLRVKECDRVAALATELSRIRPGLGTEDGDDLLVASDPGLSGQTLPSDITTYSDHRIAMGLALAGLRIKGIRILDPGCVAKTFPNYWDTLGSLDVAMDFDRA